MRFMDTPQHSTRVLETVKPVDVEVVGHHEQQYLRGKWPVTDDAVARRPGRMIDPSDESADDKPEHETLDQRITDQVERESISHELLTVIWPQSLGDDDDDRPTDDDRGCEDLPRHDAADITRRSFLRTASSLSWTRLTPSPSARSMSRMFA